MRVCVLGSGSSGNALLIASGGTRVLVEAGIGPRVTSRRLAELGVDLRPGELDGIVGTHHHGDHFRHAGRLAAAFGAPLYAHAGIDVTGLAPTVEVRSYDVGRPFRIGALTFSTVAVPHDVPQVAVRADDGARALGLATDVGRVTPGLVALLADCDAALVEANHCPDLLRASDYPEAVKRRVAGGLGHLSNAQTADLASKLAGTRLARLWLGHLSRTNNTPERAMAAVAARARRIEVGVVPGATPIVLDVTGSRPYQLGLPL